MTSSQHFYRPVGFYTSTVSIQGTRHYWVEDLTRRIREHGFEVINEIDEDDKTTSIVCTADAGSYEYLLVTTKEMIKTLKEDGYSVPWWGIQN